VLKSIHSFTPAPSRRGFRLMPPGPGCGSATSPVFAVSADHLWWAWLAVTAQQPRTKLAAQDADKRRTLHFQHSRVFRFPDLVHAEIMDIEGHRASIAIDSRARYGYYDFGVNRRRVYHWIALLAQEVSGEVSL
jgi:uncharacterized protein (DUF1499 family)